VDTVVQPDLSVTCDRNTVTERSCIGAPEPYVYQEKRSAEFESRRFTGLIVRLSDLFSDRWG
jgi:hypothetical protein